MKKTVLLTCLSLSACLSANAQSDSKEGKAILQTFGNFHTGFGKDNDDRGFELERAYLGYEYKLGGGLSMKGVMDIGAKTDGYDRVAYVKNALVSWKTGDWTLNGGLISTTQFNMIEKFWGYRYIYKSFQDQYKFGSSADLGLSAAYKPAQWVSLDGIIVNGEGYKKVQIGDGMLYGVGATFFPVDGLTLRVYGGINEQPDKKNTVNYSAFAGYKNSCFSLGAEYNYMQNYKGQEDHDRSGLSIYSTVKAGKNSEVFARYDNISSKDDWSLTDDEGVLLVGAQFKLGKYIKLAPNFRMSMPKEDAADNKYSAYVSCSFGL